MPYVGSAHKLFDVIALVHFSLLKRCKHEGGSMKQINTGSIHVEKCAFARLHYINGSNGNHTIVTIRDSAEKTSDNLLEKNQYQVSSLRGEGEAAAGEKFV